ncbi:hypothetical protein PDJAM_G00214960 [Pangasius djambal]|uniref:Uncharacterized protein n=1 Tax=Pangasius djambal TaxID=1691987 RepID=A0ACC5YAX5_9TELE|nr:hypothetical protein [Pangasius djambal]
MSNELYRFSLEGISSILFETRIGCLENEIPAETQNFINSIAQMFTYTANVNLLPKWTRNYLPFWRRYISGWDGIFRFACKLIDRKMEDIQMHLDAGQEVSGQYLSYLLSNTNMSKKDVYGSVTELLLAGVDTNFINSIAQMFTYTMMVSLLPKWTRNYFPFWRRYISGWDGIFRFGCKLIDRKMEDIQMRLDAGQEVSGQYLSYLLSNTNMSKKDVYGSVTELLLGGVDTTSNTMMWALYLLSQDPKAQGTLYQEVNSIIKEDKIPTAEDINSMPYLKAVIKETLRMYPVVPMNVRLLSENDVIIGEHFFPKKTSFIMHHYAISHDETIFPEPRVFKPERWLRDGRERPSPFGSIPFGFGVRGEGEKWYKLRSVLNKRMLHPKDSVKYDNVVNEVHWRPGTKHVQ